MRIRKELDPRWRYIYSITQEFLQQWTRAFTIGTNELKNAASLNMLQQALENGDPAVVINGLPWQIAEEKQIAGWRPSLERVMQRAGAAELRRLQIPLRFDLQNPYALRYIEQHTAKLVTQVTLETKKAIRSVILEGFQQGYPPRRMGMRIRELVGLTDRDAKAVTRYWNTLNKKGVLPASRIDELADAYSRKLHRLRAENIARTETVDAAASGTHHSQLQARDRGLLPIESKRIWIEAPEPGRTCEFCLELGAKYGQEGVGLEEEFYSDMLGESVMNPPLHPRCRCATGLITPRP